MDVQLKGRYTLPRKQGIGKGEGRGVRRAQKLFHDPDIGRLGPGCHQGSQGDGRKMSLDDASQKPHDRLNAYLSEDMERVNALIRDRMASEHAPRIPR